MESPKKFSCPRCGKRFPLRLLFFFRKYDDPSMKGTFHCPHCGVLLRSKEPYSSGAGFTLGSLLIFGIGQICLFKGVGFLPMLSIALPAGALFLLAMFRITYCKTTFSIV